MHELSLTLSLLEIVEEYVRQYDIRRVNALRLSLGRLSCCEPQSLTFAFEIQSRGTKVEGAALQFDIRPIIIYCFSCQKESELQENDMVCPLCQGKDVLLIGGTDELQLLEIDCD